MTDATDPAGANADLEFDEGRYLYCAVRAADDESFTAEGIEDGTTSLLVRDGIGVVAQPVDSVYDSDDMTRVRSWLLAHQQVVDEAGQRFGTPLPFRFDTIITGDDEAVREWLRDAHDDLESFLAEFAGYWEYRVEIVRTDAPEFDDERLDELREEVEQASEGRAFLVEKQLDERRKELRRTVDREIAADARERLEPLARELEAAENPDGVASFSLLAHEDDEEAVGEQLDAVADNEGIEVRFTGPWPPYSFAPEL